LPAWQLRGGLKSATQRIFRGDICWRHIVSGRRTALSQSTPYPAGSRRLISLAASTRWPRPEALRLAWCMVQPKCDWTASRAPRPSLPATPCLAALKPIDA